MKASELRLGNLVIDENGNVIPVTGICEEIIYLGFGKERAFDSDPDYLSPIIVTKQWLEKIGATIFAGQPNQYLLKDRLITLAECRNIWIDSTTSVELLTIHQLQNFFFIHQGKDLELETLIEVSE